MLYRISEVFRNLWELILKYKCSTQLREDWIEKYVPGDYHLLSLVMPNGDPGDRFYYIIIIIIPNLYSTFIICAYVQKCFTQNTLKHTQIH